MATGEQSEESLQYGLETVTREDSNCLIALKAVQGTITLYKKCAVCSLKEQLVREGWCPSAPFPGAKVPGKLRCGGYTWLVLMSLCLMVCLPGLNADF